MKTAKLGILMLDTDFYRPKGDIGNPDTFPFPVEYRVVEKATIDRVVKKGDAALIEPFIESARYLEETGVKAITTSCGFLSIFQQEIQNQLKVPFFASSLIQIPMLHTVTGGRIGILTARKASLDKQHLEGARAADIPIAIEGMDDRAAFTAAIVDETHALDMEKVSLEMKEAVRMLISNYPDITAIVLECTNMPPYKRAIREVTDLPVFDITTLINYVVKEL
ncbi:aspartate/glutamate racemase family protein [Virgibacillus litoralis]|uniref:Aspartate/glutamate racemase n=1 Tax=Virgibacillus litoralis TaxID=578221 RepID=A0ABS4HJQ2_9BACI|nr:aspartate/glutamate racemase family protein [Virgibacillus litoralis]MBP1950959.1 aspartate/glutamate racemase [Virgibacillus litoralis]